MHSLLNPPAATVPTEANSTMTIGGIGSMLSLFLIFMLFGSGIYAVYTYIRLRRTYMLFPNRFLYPGNCTAETCVDVDGFIDFIGPRILLLGIAMIVCGGAYLAYTLLLQGALLWVDIVTLIVPTAIFVWYMFVQRKAAKEYWG